MEQLNYNIEIKKNQEKYFHLSISERNKIQILYNQGISYREISKRISRSHTTVMREIKRNGRMNQPSLSAKRAGQKKYSYNFNIAQKSMNEKFQRPKTQKKFNQFLDYARSNLISPMTLEDLKFNFEKSYPNYQVPSLKTLYNWAHKGIISYPGRIKIVRSKSNKKKTQDTRGDVKNISERVKKYGFEKNNYSHIGHYEIDTIYNGDKKGGVLTFNHRATRMLYAVQIDNRKATTINKALRQIISKIGAENILSITSDNGREFYYSKVIENCYNIDWYYCDPYTSSQRGQNERLNRDIRKYYPKGYDLTNISKTDFNKTIAKINDKPRRIFSGLSAKEFGEYLKYNSNRKYKTLDTNIENYVAKNDILLVA